ncbi:histidine--tRNA ligase [bacterium]|nr:histidine--tRNA ligase [bacterium]
MQKPSNPKGTRDFGPAELRKRNHILNTIRSVFENFGFQPIETPAFENLSTLTGKYGEEGDKLLFRILNSGELVKSVKTEHIEKEDNIAFIQSISKKGLRYDLTVPFARYVVQHSNEVVFPFRRYQIQQVWRADRPGKGRFQEFTQCDADIIGSKSMVNEADLVLIYEAVFKKLGLSNAILKINHRKFLEALVQELNLNFEVTQFTSTLDKLDKIGEAALKEEFLKLGVTEHAIDQLFTIITEEKISLQFLDKVEQAFNHNPLAVQACTELREVVQFAQLENLDLDVRLDLSLARGLDYYTGCIFESVVPDSGIGSISGGGRYDDLTGVFGLKDVSGVGISFGIDRIYEVMANLNLFDDHAPSDTILLCHFDEESRNYQYGIAKTLRSKGMAAFIFPDTKKIAKQLDYANKRNVRFVLIAGGSEIESESVTVKDMISGSNTEVKIGNLSSYLIDQGAKVN